MTGEDETSDDLDRRMVDAIGEPAARELLDVLTCSDTERAALIGRLHLREDASWLADLVIDIEEDELVRLQLVEALRRVLQ